MIEGCSGASIAPRTKRLHGASYICLIAGPRTNILGCNGGLSGLRKTWFDLCLLGGAALITALQFGLFPTLFEPGWTGVVALVLLTTVTEPLHN